MIFAYNAYSSRRFSYDACERSTRPHAHALYFTVRREYSAADSHLGDATGAGELFLFLAGRVDKSKRVLARVKLDTATVDHVALDTSFSPAAAGGYQGPEWAAPAVA